MHVIFLPGNAGCKTTDNWFPYLKNKLEKMGHTVIASEFPDSDLARASYWLPFLKNVLKADKNSILIGHSSGAVASMRFAENHKIYGSVLVGAHYTDLGIEKEKQSGYFNTPWRWEEIKKNQNWIIQFASIDDPWIPIENSRAIHQNLNTEYHEFKNLGHFGGDYYKETFPELLAALEPKLAKIS